MCRVLSENHQTVPLYGIMSSDKTEGQKELEYVGWNVVVVGVHCFRSVGFVAERKTSLTTMGAVIVIVVVVAT